MRKPDFSAKWGGGIIDPAFLPASVRAELLLHLNASPLSEDQKVSLIDFANEHAQVLSKEERSAGQVQRDQIVKVADNARRLLACLATLDQPAVNSIDLHAHDLACLSAPSVELDEDIKEAIRYRREELLSSAWDWVAALELVATYTAEQYQIDRQSKPEQQVARGFVSLLAEHVKRLTGAAPPKDRAAWFAAFATCLGDRVGLPIGPRVIDAGIEATR